MTARAWILRLRSGEELGFELVVATGASVRTLTVPGHDLPGVRYLRSLSDSKNLRAQAAGAKRALVIGGGFIGMEVASVLAQKGISTSMLLREDRIWKQFFTPAMSSFFEGYYQARGVTFLKQAKLAELRGQGGVTSARLEGGATVDCDLVVAGIGVSPVTELLAHSGIQVDNGVVVNEYLETNQPDPGSGRRGELSGHAVRQAPARGALGQCGVARPALWPCTDGRCAPFVHVPYSFPMCSIFRTSCGVIRPGLTRSWSAATCRGPASAYGGCGSSR